MAHPGLLLAGTYATKPPIIILYIKVCLKKKHSIRDGPFLKKGTTVTTNGGVAYIPETLPWLRHCKLPSDNQVTMFVGYIFTYFVLVTCCFICCDHFKFLSNFYLYFFRSLLYEIFRTKS